ncbi:MAG: FtsQ-type POTRA domain-containing protein [Actinobacteria bacterium]|nr:FtsQ-type POTRA domain-containing protein [Actinomycetota bacterium]
MVLGLNYFYNSKYFKVKSIDIQGSTHYKDGEIISLIPEVIGANIFEINKKKDEETILELNWVKEAELRKIFPDKVIIKLVERKPFLIIVYKDKYFLMDNEGVVLDKIEKEDLNGYKDLIRVRNVVNYSVNIGDKIAKKNALSCVDIYKAFDSQIKSMIKEARLEDNISGDIVFKTYNGVEIIFGDSSEIVKKVEILKQKNFLNELLKEETNSIIDLRSPDSPVIKNSGGSIGSE